MTRTLTWGRNATESRASTRGAQRSRERMACSAVSGEHRQHAFLAGQRVFPCPPVPVTVRTTTQIIELRPLSPSPQALSICKPPGRTEAKRTVTKAVPKSSNRPRMSALNSWRKKNGDGEWGEA